MVTFKQANMYRIFDPKGKSYDDKLMAEVSLWDENGKKVSESKVEKELRNLEKSFRKKFKLVYYKMKY